MTREKDSERFFAGLGRNIFLLGAVSLFTDISSEMLYPVIPLFLTGVLRAPMSVVGVIEGGAECVASVLKAVSGWYSDRIRKRIPLVTGGYSVSALGKALLILAGSWPVVLVSRLIERMGKGMRTSARDALIAASCAPEHRGKAYGLHRAMDTIGALIGPLVALLLLHCCESSYRTVFIWALAPAALGVLILFAVREPKWSTAPAPVPAGASSGKISRELKKLLLVFGVFGIGNSSDVFLLLRAKDIGFDQSGVLLLYMFYNAVYALCAVPAGRLSDALGRKRVLVAGFCVFAVVYAGFAMEIGRISVWALFAVYGLYAAAAEGVVRAFVADLSTPENRGTAMGLLHCVTGVAAFIASAVAGLLWTRVNPQAPFLYGSICSIVALAALLALTPGNQPSRTA